MTSAGIASAAPLPLPFPAVDCGGGGVEATSSITGSDSCSCMGRPRTHPGLVGPKAHPRLGRRDCIGCGDVRLYGGPDLVEDPDALGDVGHGERAGIRIDVPLEVGVRDIGAGAEELPP